MTTQKRDLRVLVCGSRMWNDPEPIRLFLAGIVAEHTEANVCVMHTGTQGADLYADAAARMQNLDIERCDSTVDEVATADLVVAFMDDRADMRPWFTVRKARRLGLPTYVISHGGD